MPFNPGVVVTVDFPGVTGIKRRPAVVLSSAVYHAARPDVIVGLVTSRTTGLGATDSQDTALRKSPLASMQKCDRLWNTKAVMPFHQILATHTL